MSETRGRRPAAAESEPAAAATPDVVGPLDGVEFPDNVVASVMNRLRPYVQHLPACDRTPCTCGLAEIVPTLAPVQMTARRYGGVI